MTEVNAKMNLLEQIVQATVEGDEERCVALAQQVLDQGLNPVEAIEEGYSKAMVIVGDRFARMEYFLPDLILSARAMNGAMQVLRPHLLKQGGGGAQGTIVLGTIQGDLHDVGKNIVKIMLQASGFDVQDLGVDVSVRRFIEKAEEVDADIIAASAILTTTMAYMPDIGDLLTEMGIRDRYRIMLGGGPVTSEWAEKVGACGYGENAIEAVEVAKRLMQEKRGGKQR
jgi:corrinoid protein of di/trimethylamine methyltransferase